MKALAARMGVASTMVTVTQQSQPEKKPMTVARITPVLAVPEVQPCVRFWVERMGFKLTAEVPDGNTVGFALLERDGVELMYPSYHCIEGENAAMAELAHKGPTFLYVEVDHLDEVIARMNGVQMAMPVRTTFYGMKELGAKDPGRARWLLLRRGRMPGNRKLDGRVYFGAGLRVGASIFCGEACWVIT